MKCTLPLKNKINNEVLESWNPFRFGCRGGETKITVYCSINVDSDFNGFFFYTTDTHFYKHNHVCRSRMKFKNSPSGKSVIHCTVTGPPSCDFALLRRAKSTACRPCNCAVNQLIYPQESF